MRAKPFIARTIELKQDIRAYAELAHIHREHPQGQAVYLQKLQAATDELASIEAHHVR